MNKIIKGILDRDFKNCLYSKGIFEYKVSELINKEYEVKEIYNDTKNAVVDIGGVCKVKLTLSDTSYIRSINVE